MRFERMKSIVGRATGEAFGVKDTADAEHPSRPEIARLAYAFYEERGRGPGHELDDWLRAESELCRHFANVGEGESRP